MAAAPSTLMTIPKLALSLWISACLLFAGYPSSELSRTTQETFSPSVGQSGKDVIWVPTPQALVDRMLDMAGLTRDDYVIDLGSGDGRTVSCPTPSTWAIGSPTPPWMPEAIA